MESRIGSTIPDRSIGISLKTILSKQTLACKTSVWASGWIVGGSLVERLQPIYQLHVDVEHNATGPMKTGKPRCAAHRKSASNWYYSTSTTRSRNVCQPESIKVESRRSLSAEKLQMPYCQNNNNTRASSAAGATISLPNYMKIFYKCSTNI